MPLSASSTTSPVRATTRAWAKPLVTGCALAMVLTTPGLAAAADEPQPGCTQQLAPPPPVDSSEVPEPGQPSPGPLPLPDEPVGGPQLGSCDLVLPADAPPPPPEVDAASWVLADLDTGDVLAARDPHARHRPASTIKVLTSLVVLDELNLDDEIVATQADADQEGSRIGLFPGTTYTVRQVLTGMLLQSGNDAAHALAMKLGGVEATVEKMNALAGKIGALDTRAATPSGLDGPGMSTSAYDLSVIFQHAMRHPDFARAVGTRQLEIPGKPGEPPMTVSSDNKVMQQYAGAIGGKTGFTDDARHTFIAGAERDGRRLAVVLLRGENQPMRQSDQAMHLLDYGFGLPRGLTTGVLGKAAEPTNSPEATDKTGAPASAGPSTSDMFGTVGAPLTIVAGIGVLLMAGLTLRKRLARRR